MTGDGGGDCIMNSERKLLAAIRARCMDCSGHCKKEVEHCLIPECALYPYRMGKMPEETEPKEAQINGQVSIFDEPCTGGRQCGKNDNASFQRHLELPRL